MNAGYVQPAPGDQVAPMFAAARQPAPVSAYAAAPYRPPVATYAAPARPQVGVKTLNSAGVGGCRCTAAGRCRHKPAQLWIAATPEAGRGGGGATYIPGPPRPVAAARGGRGRGRAAPPITVTNTGTLH